MLEEMWLGGFNREQIVVQTRTGRPLENYIAPPLDQQHINGYYGALRRCHGRNWVLRKHAIGIYNCAGMVFASRRTALTNPDEWEMILTDDQYRRLPRIEDAFIGDVVVYRNGENNQILHLARVCELRWLRDEGNHALGKPIVRALSKWDQSCGEDIHLLDDVFLEGGCAFHAEIWTDRPAEPDPRVSLVPELLL